MVRDFFSVFKFTNKQLQFISILLIGFGIPFSFLIGLKVNNYSSSIDEVKDKMGIIHNKIIDSETILSSMSNEQIKMKEKQNQLYYLIIENNKLLDKKLEFIINYREQDKNYILDAIKIINNSEDMSKNNENVIIFTEKELEMPTKKPESNISINKSN